MSTVKVRRRPGRRRDDTFGDETEPSSPIGEDGEGEEWGPSVGETPARLLRRDLREAAKSMGPAEARFLVDTYYQYQLYRIASEHQKRVLTQGGEPHAAIAWTSKAMERMEVDVRAMLDSWTMVEPTGMGAWARAIVGIGPVIAAGLAAHIDVTKAPSASHVWGFAGLRPDTRWEKGQKRPWNARLKTLAWKIGESFVRMQGRQGDYYGKLFAQRKEYEWDRNISGALATQADAKLERFDIDEAAEVRFWYEGRLTSAAARAILAAKPSERQERLRALAGAEGSGVKMLPPGHVHERSKRWTVKLFLAHYWEEAYRRYFNVEPPAPYPIAFLEHVDRIPAPDRVAI
jgi:hypothetical protein